MKQLLLLLPALFIAITSFSQANNVGIGTVSPDPSAVLDIQSTNQGILLPRMDSLSRVSITAPANGLIVFDNTSNSIWYYNDTEWQELSSGGGVFTLENGVVNYSNDDDLAFGTENLPQNGTFTTDKLFFYDQSLGAFRVGELSNSEDWNSDSLGVNSVAIGHNTRATGQNAFAQGNFSQARAENSVALGFNAKATGDNSLALGTSSIASGDRSFALWGGNASGTGSVAFPTTAALGYYSRALGNSCGAIGNRSASLGFASQSYGDYSTAIGYRSHSNAFQSTVLGAYNELNPWNETQWVSTDPILEVGNGEYPNDRSTAFTILKNGTISFLHYTFPNIDGSPDQVLSTDGSGNISWTDSDTSLFELDNDVIQYKASGDQDLALNLDSLPQNGVPYTEFGLLFDGEKGALRFGTSYISESWTPTEVGYYSAGFGSSTLASGNGSVAMGGFTQATGSYSTAINNETKANGYASAAMGRFSQANGDISMAAGRSTIADAYSSAVFGRYNVGTGDNENWVETDPLFEVGNGSSHLNKNNALTILKNGTISFENYTFPDNDGTADQVIHTDGNGTLTWKDPSFVFEEVSNLTRAIGNYTNDLVLGSDTLPQNGQTITNTLFLMDKSKKAFRIGSLLNSSNWAEDSIGISSIAFGLNTKAKGEASSAFGLGTEAMGPQSISTGKNTVAKGTNSFATGKNTRAGSFVSTAIGRYNVGGGSAVAWNDNDPLMEVGNGDSDATRNNAFTIYKSGIAEFADSLHIGGNLNVGTGVGSRIYIGKTMMQSGAPSMLRVDANIRPYDDDSFDLGSSGKRWQDVFTVNPVTSTSDKRLKKNIVPSSYGLSEILLMNPISFHWKKEDKTDKKHIGLIAQELLELVPELVSEKGDYLGVKYAELVPILIQAIHDQQEIIENQNTTIKGLHNHQETTENTLQTILERIAKLEQMNSKASVNE